MLNHIRYSKEFLVIFSWVTAFNPTWIPVALSCGASIMAMISYYYSIKKNRKS